MISAWGNKWGDDEQQLASAQVEAFGERFRFEPRLSRPNKASIPDPSRSIVEFCGVLTDPGLTTMMRREGSGTLSSNPTLEVHQSQLPNVLQHDQIVRLACGREVARYEVTSPKGNGQGLWKLGLVALS